MTGESSRLRLVLHYSTLCHVLPQIFIILVKVDLGLNIRKIDTHIWVSVGSKGFVVLLTYFMHA